MGKQSTPHQRASEVTKDTARIRRKYKQNVNKPKKFSRGEEPWALFMTVVLKLAGYTSRQIASIVGISKGQVKALLESPEGQQKLGELRQSIPSAALELLHGYMIEAVQAIVEVLRHSEDDKMILTAAAEILDRGGMPKSSRQEKENKNTENLVVTDDGLLEKLREAPPEVQEQAASMIENLENLLAEHASTATQPEEVEDETT